MYLLNLVADTTAEAGLRLHLSITNLTNKIQWHSPCSGRQPGRRLAAKIGYHAVSSPVSYELSPIHLGVFVKGGVEAAVDAVRKFISDKIDSHDSMIIVKLDMKNAFNSVRYDHVLLIALTRSLSWPFTPTTNRRQSLLLITQ